MICRYCGNQISDEAKFCPHCGAANGGSATPSYPVPTVPEAPAGGGRGRKGLLIGGAVAVLAVVTAAAVAMGGLFSNPKGKLEKAAARSAAAYAQAEARMGLPDTNQLTQKRSISQRMSLELTDISDQLTGYSLSDLEGLGFRMSTDLDGKNRRLGFELAAFWDEEDILSLQLAAENDKLYFASPELTEGDFYGVNTETLGEDLKRMGSEGAGDVSFNIFDLVDIAAPEGMAEEMEQSLQRAGKDLWEAARVDQEGKESITVNGKKVNAEVYLVVIPQRALEDYVDDVADALDSVDYVELYEKMLQATGMSQNYIDDILSQLDGLDSYSSLARTVKEGLAVLGEVRLRVYVSGGYVSAVRYDERIRGTSVKLDLYLGGGEEYVDDISLTMEIDGVKLTVESTGDHGGKSGVFTDSTTLRAGGMSLTSQFRYDPKGAGNNLSWSLKAASYGSLDMEGRLTTGKDSMDLHMEEISLKIMGLEVFSLGLDYYVGPYDGQGVTVVRPKLITELDGMEQMALVLKITGNAQVWLARTQELFAQRLPAELFNGLAA